LFKRSNSEKWDLVTLEVNQSPEGKDPKVRFEELFLNSGISSDMSALYASLFVANNIDFSLLDDIDHEFLKTVGVEALGDRIKILKKLQSHEMCTHPKEDQMTLLVHRFVVLYKFFPSSLIQLTLEEKMNNSNNHLPWERYYQIHPFLRNKKVCF
jgi:hypothetical protein